MSTLDPLALKDPSATRDHKPRAVPDARQVERRRSRGDDELARLIEDYGGSDRRARGPIGLGTRTHSALRPAAENRAVLLEIEPGMDLRMKPVERTAGCIDEQDPYP